MKVRVALGMFAFVLVVATAGFRSSLAQAPAQPPSPLPAASLECLDLAAALRTVANNDARLRDWPQIARYREANRTLTSSDVVFMGDSITDPGRSRDSARSSQARTTSAVASAARPRRRC